MRARVRPPRCPRLPAAASACSAAPVSSTKLPPPTRREREAAVVVLLAREPARRSPLTGARARGPPGGAQRQDPERRPVRLALERAVGVAAREQLGDQVAAREPACVERRRPRSARIVRSSSPVSLQLRERPRAHVVDRRLAVPAYVQRVAARRLEAEHGPAREQLVRGLRRGAPPKPPSAFCARSR